jgi:arylsulfatase A-like enzyme
VEANRDRPFFLYLPHSMPHIPLYVPEDVYDPDPLHAYICVIEHIDAECGRLFDRIEALGLAGSTYIAFTSDNGPWLRFKHHGGSADPLRDGKGTTFEGGQRVPFVIRGPGIPPGSVSDELVSSLDLLPTVATLAGCPLKPAKKIDGLDVSAVMKGGGPSPRREFLHYTSQGQIEGLRQDDWKLLVKRPRKKRADTSATKAQPEILLFNLADDVGERHNLADRHPERVRALRARMEELDAEITANARPIFGAR